MSGATTVTDREAPPAPAPAAPAPAPPAPVSPDVTAPEGRLYAEGYAFDFFQAVRVLARLDARRRPVGHAGPPDAEAVRFKAHLSLTFPPSQIYEVAPPTEALPVPAMTVAFLGLTGPSGVLPHHYTELLLRLERGERGPEQEALRAWLDLFDHRIISHFYRAWEKYRFWLAWERGEHVPLEPDPFTRALASLVGVGMPSLRGRLAVTRAYEEDGVPRREVLASVNDLGLLYYAGLLAHRPRCAAGLESLLQDYFGLPVEVRQFHGTWLRLDEDNQSRLGAANCGLGADAVAGERVWDVAGKVRLRVGPLGYAAFTEFTPDPAPVRARKSFFLLVRLARLYIGPELLFDVQLVLRAAEVPACRLDAGGVGPRLGWNTWLCSVPRAADAEDAVFEGEELVSLG